MPTYCDASDVRVILQAVQDFSSETTPTDADIDNLIEGQEAEIDNTTHHSWKEVTVTDEYYDIPEITEYNRSTGIPIYLKHREVKAFDTAKGDKIEVWNGSSYDDWVTVRTQGRASDWWVDQSQGILYLRAFFLFMRKQALRVTYRYGGSAVPADIKQATALLVAAQVLSSDDRSMVVAETGDATRTSHKDRIQQWTDKANSILWKRTEYISVL